MNPIKWIKKKYYQAKAVWKLQYLISESALASRGLDFTVNDMFGIKNNGSDTLKDETQNQK